MVLLRRFETPQFYRGGYVSIGNFDGVHTGHRRIVEFVARCAAADGVPAVAMTFDPHPLKLLRPDRVPQRLTTLEHKAELLEQSGATCVVACPTDRKLLRLTPDQFFDAIVVSELRAKGVVEGPNFCFGKNRQGDIVTLRDLCQSRGVSLHVVEPVAGAGGMVSSSAIRSLVVEGRLAEAVALLGHPHRVSGRVVVGARRGRTLGFPTANLADVETLVPGDGVYAGTAAVDGQVYTAAVNIGPNPTFQEELRKIEAHLIGFSGDLYARRLDVDVVARIRDARVFGSRDELTAQLADDLRAAQAVVSSGTAPEA